MGGAHGQKRNKVPTNTSSKIVIPLRKLLTRRAHETAVLSLHERTSCDETCAVSSRTEGPTNSVVLHKDTKKLGRNLRCRSIVPLCRAFSAACRGEVAQQQHQARTHPICQKCLQRLPRERCRVPGERCRKGLGRSLVSLVGYSAGRSTTASTSSFRTWTGLPSCAQGGSPRAR